MTVRRLNFGDDTGFEDVGWSSKTSTSPWSSTSVLLLLDDSLVKIVWFSISPSFSKDSCASLRIVSSLTAT